MATPKKAAKPAAKAKKTAPAKAKVVKKVQKSKPKPVAKAKTASKSAVKKPIKAAAKPVKKAPAKPIAKAKPAATKKIVAKKPVVAAKKAPIVNKPIVKAPAAKPLAKVAVKPLAKTPAKPEVSKEQQIKPKALAKVEAAKPAAPKPVSVVPVAKAASARNVRDIKVAPAKPISIPKISTKSVKKYQPDFTKSVLDQPKSDPGAPIVRYSDYELTEFRDLIQRKLELAKKELSYLQGLITRKDEMGGDDTDNRYMTMEDGSLSMEREQLSQMASRQITYIDHLEKALMRIENKTYGICRVSGKLIDKARLKAVPHATLSIEAKMNMNK